MKLNIFLSFHLLLGCWLFISCQNVQRNFEHLNNSSHKILDKINHPKELDEYLEKNRNKRATSMNNRSFKIFKTIQSYEELPNLSNRSFAEADDSHEMKILKNADYSSQPFSENKNENLRAKIVLGPELEGKAYKSIKSSKHLNEYLPANRIRRESPQIFRYTGGTETKKQISPADKFLKLDEKERQRLLEKVFNEINRKLNRSKLGNGCIDKDGSVEVKPQLLILNSKSKAKREESRETEPSVFKEVENPYSTKRDATILSDSFNDNTETVSSADLKTKFGTSPIGRQTSRNNVNIEQFTTNSENFSKQEGTQYQADGIHLTTFLPEASEQNDEITTDQSDNIQSKYTAIEKPVKQRNKNGQLQLYQILKNPTETNKVGQSEVPLGSSKRMNKNYEDSELMEYIKNNVKNCLREMKKDAEEEQEKTETMERNQRDEATSDTNQTKETIENYPKEISPELIKQFTLIDKLNNLNPNSPGFQLLWNILQSTPSIPNFLLEKNQKNYAENFVPYNYPLIAEENYLDEASSEETGNDSYDMILQTGLRNLNDFVRAYTKPNVEAAKFDRFLYLLDELF